MSDQPSPRVGVLIPTFQRPDLVRACVLQWLVQSLKPDCICVHQNGSPQSYAWSVEDLHVLGRIDWLHTPARLHQNHWYGVPLQHLLDQGCTHFFWSDHDDWYRIDHVQRCIAELADTDFTVASHCGVLYLRHDDYRFEPASQFTVHSTGGMSSSMAFNRAFAEQLAADLERDTTSQYADNVLALATLPQFQRLVSSRRTTVYVSHRGSLTSASWLDGVFPESSEPARPDPEPSKSQSSVLYGTLGAGYRDVTRQVMALCITDGFWQLPEGDLLRSQQLGDPAPNQLKHLVLRALPDASGQLLDRVVRDIDRCTFRTVRGVLSAELELAR